MAQHARTPDYLHSHVNVDMRLRNLETGVHPTTADMGYWDNYGPQTIPDSSTLLSPVAGAAPKWSRRTGSVYLAGQLQGTLGDIAADGEPYGKLDKLARPNEQQTQVAAISVAPFYTLVTIAVDGTITIAAPTGIAAGATGTVALDNIAYPVD